MELSLLPRRNNPYQTYLDLNDLTKLVYLIDKGGSVELSPVGHSVLDAFNTHHLLKDLPKNMKVALLLHEAVILSDILEQQLADALNNCAEDEECTISSITTSLKNQETLMLH